MGGCTFVDTQFSIFTFLPFFQIFLRCPQLYKYYAYRLPFFVNVEKRGAYAFVHPFGSESGVFLLPLPLFPLSYWLRRNLPMIFLYQFFPHFGAEYFSRGTCCRLPFLLACLLCSAFFLILGRVCFLSARNGLLGLS